MTAKLRFSPGTESASYAWVTSLTGFAPKIEVRSIDHPEALSSCLATVSVLPNIIGIFGLPALRVQQRTREVGVRTALGADRVQVVRMILSEAFSMIASGIAIAGVCGVFIRRFLFGISPCDPGMATASVAILLLAGLASASIPALRVAQLNPYWPSARNDRNRSHLTRHALETTMGVR